jgi:hypothetical protein
MQTMIRLDQSFELFRISQTAEIIKIIYVLAETIFIYSTKERLYAFYKLLG